MAGYQAEMKHLDLFSGIGGFALGLQRAGFDTVAFCEIEPYAQKVLKKHWPDTHIYEDIHDVTAQRLEADGFTGIDIITGGYPCQPFSAAGKRGGEDDDRHLWPQIARLVRELSAAGEQPDWLLFENVAGHITLGLDTVLADLEALGYTGRPLVIPACAVDARHRRDRLWIIANSEHYGLVTGRDKRIFQGISNGSAAKEQQIKGCIQDVAKAISQRGRSRQATGEHASNAGQQPRHPWNNAGGVATWPAETAICRVANGIPRRVDRLRGLGNAVVPQIPENIGRAIIEASR